MEKIPYITNGLCDMNEGYIDVASTSLRSADVSDIVLARSKRYRCKFSPRLVDNKQDSKKAISGKLVYEKKKEKESEFPSDVSSNDEKISRGSIKTGNWMEINLNTSETYELYMGLKNIYSLYEDIQDIPSGVSRYVRIDPKTAEVLEKFKDNPLVMQMIGNEKCYKILETAMDFVTQVESHEALERILETLKNENLQELTASLNLEKLKRVAKIMENNMDNDNEEFWQSHVFKEHQWILAQIFSCPYTIFAEKAYVGGKQLDNRGGNICDFIYQNNLSQNLALIEIKTPCTKLIGSAYRGTYSLSSELSGAVNQVLNYKEELMKNSYFLLSKEGKDINCLAPKCVVVIGKMNQLSKDKMAALENFRNSFTHVTIITFDELYRKILDLIKILSAEN